VEYTRDNVIRQQQRHYRRRESRKTVRFDALVLSGIGEPLFHPELDRFIQIAAGLMPSSSWIGIAALLKTGGPSSRGTGKATAAASCGTGTAAMYRGGEKTCVPECPETCPGIP